MPRASRKGAPLRTRTPAPASILAAVFFSFALAPGSARAQGPPIHTDTPIMLGLEGRGVRTFLKVLRKDKLLQDGEEIPDAMNRTATAYVVPIAVPYNLTATFQAGAVLPTMRKSLETTTGSTSRSGFGDLTLFAKKLLVQVDRRAETFRLALKASAKLPTGDEEGSPPLGSGSTDYGLSAVAGWIRGRWGLYGELLAAHRTSRGEIDYGDRGGLRAAAGFRALPAVYRRYPSKQLNLYLELLGETTQPDEIAGREDRNSGGTSLHLAPGIQVVGGRRWLVEGSVQWPVIDEPNGVQLGAGWSASLGTRILLF